jgi:hypothetical protein
MNGAGLAGKCLPVRPGKGSFQGVGCSPEAKPSPFRRCCEHRGPIQPETLQREVVRPIRELEAESQNGILG